MKPDKTHIQSISLATVISLVSMFGGWKAFIQPAFQLEVTNQIETYIESDKYNEAFHKKKFLEFIKTPDFKEQLAEYLDSNTNSTNNSLSLITLLAVKLDVNEHEVPNKLVEIIKTVQMEEKDKERLANLLRAVNAEHPEYNVWQTNN